jgi:hypothetical protein
MFKKNKKKSSFGVRGREGKKPNRTGRFKTEPAGLVPNRPVRYQTGRFRLKPVGRFGFSTGSTRSASKPVKPAGFGSNRSVFKTLVTQ